MQPNEAFSMQKGNRLDNSEEKVSELENVLSFKIERSLYGINFDLVHEVVDYFPPTEYPIESPGHVGIINLRGNVIPIITPFGKTNLKNVNESFKYVILESNNGNLVGIVIEKARKLEVLKSELHGINEDRVISINNMPLRYLSLSAILKKYKENENDND